MHMAPKALFEVLLGSPSVNFACRGDWWDPTGALCTWAHSRILEAPVPPFEHPDPGVHSFDWAAFFLVSFLPTPFFLLLRFSRF